MLVARLSLAPRWDRFSRWVPKFLVHRWSLGTMALVSLALFFVAPFVVAGRWDVALVGLLSGIAVVAVFGRDILAWVLDDLREHRAEARGLFTHGHDCVAHRAYERPEE